MRITAQQRQLNLESILETLHRELGWDLDDILEFRPESEHPEICRVWGQLAVQGRVNDPDQEELLDGFAQ